MEGGREPGMERWGFRFIRGGRIEGVIGTL